MGTSAMPPSGLAAVATLLVSLIASGALLWGAASKRRAADDAVRNARSDADRTLKQAERDAETLRKEAALEAREKAHDLAAEAEKQARERRQEIVGLEQGLADKTRALADRLAATDRVEQDLRGREKALASHEQRAAAAASRAEQLVAERQRELQRVAGLSADEARELLLKQIEGDARRDAANLVKRLETEARETAATRAQQIITDAIQRSTPSKRQSPSSTCPATTSRAASSGARVGISGRWKRRPASS
jgi:ribonuclease Y